MARQKVYGKRSRTVYGSAAIFGSPQFVETAAVKASGEAAATTLANQIQELELGGDASNSESSDRGRVVLGETVANEIVESAMRFDTREKQPRRRKQKVVAETEEKQQVPKAKNDTLHGLAQQVGFAQFQTKTVLEGEPDKENIAPLPAAESCDVHGIVSEKGKPHQDKTPILALPDERPASAPEQLLSPGQSVSPLQKNVYTDHCRELLELSAHPVTSFADWADAVAEHFRLTKIAEASFGEVYRLSLLEQIPGFSTSDESVFKVISLRPPPSILPRGGPKRKTALKKAESMSTPEDVASEVKLLQRMRSIPGFTNFRDMRILQGRPPRIFINAFREFNASQRANNKDVSVFPDPAKKTSYSDDQLWAVIEMQDAGTDLERLLEAGTCTDIWGIWDIFWQVVLSLAKGEEGAEFEHRDLHLGNICVRSPPSPTTEAVDVTKKLGFTTMETTVIDYTISRCLMPDQSIAYHDLNRDHWLFEGDGAEDYQYDVYRYMRGVALLRRADADFSQPAIAAAAARSGRTWQQYQPVTNLVWLHFLLYKLLEQLEWPSAQKAPPARAHNKLARTQWKRAVDLEHRLCRVQTLLDPDTLCTGEMRSASDLVDLALREGWLDVDDVLGAADDCDGSDRDDGVEDVTDKMQDLKVKVDLIEERGLETAVGQARATRVKKKASR